MVGYRHGLFGIADIVLDSQDNPSAVYAAGRVYVFGGQFGPALDLIARLREGTGHRGGDSDPDVLSARGASAKNQSRDE